MRVNQCARMDLGLSTSSPHEEHFLILELHVLCRFSLRKKEKKNKRFVLEEMKNVIFSHFYF